MASNLQCPKCGWEHHPTFKCFGDIPAPPMKTHHCPGCKERQDRIDELEAEAVQLKKIHADNCDAYDRACLEREFFRSRRGFGTAELESQFASVIAAGDGLVKGAEEIIEVSGWYKYPQMTCVVDFAKALTNWNAAKGDLG